MKLKFVILILPLLLCAAAFRAEGQHIAVNNNLLFDIGGALSAGVELPLTGTTSLEAYGSIRPWKRTETSVHKHWLLQAQYRMWTCQVMNGFFFGPYIHAGEFNIGNHDLVFGMLNSLKPYRYEGWLAGLGIGAGYEYAIARHWNIGAEAGVGYTFIDYRKYNCEVCGGLKGSGFYHYLGLSRLGVSLIYLF